MFVFVGLLVGLVAAIPIGPVNVFIASQTLKRDFFHGFLAASTTALLDVIYCGIALIGFFQLKINYRPEAVLAMKIFGGLIIISIGYKLTHDSKKFILPENGNKLPPAASKPILGVIALYVINPSVYIFWAAVASTMTSHEIVSSSSWQSLLFALACGLGAIVWYSTVVSFISRKQHKITPDTLKKILFAFGLILIAFGLYTIASVFITPAAANILRL